MSKITAVEWLFAHLVPHLDWSKVEDRELFIKLREEALEMDIEQKKFMFDCGRQYQLTGEGTFTEVYNETYKGGNNE